MKQNNTKVRASSKSQTKDDTSQEAIMLSNLAQVCELSEDFIERNQNILNWKEISLYQVLSEKFIEKFINRVDMKAISWSQCLSEAFIEKHADIVNWNLVAGYQDVSIDFLEKHKDKYDTYYIFLNPNISDDYKLQHKDYILNHEWKHNEAVELMFALRYSTQNTEKMVQTFREHLINCE